MAMFLARPAFALVILLTTVPPTQPKVVDAMRDFFRVYHRTDSPVARVLIFRKFIRSYADVYTKQQRAMDDTALAHYLASSEAYLPMMRRVDKTLRMRMPLVVNHFRAAFPDFDTAFGIYLIPSLNSFDGTVRDVGKETGVLVGVDQLTEIGNTTALKLDVVVTHEFVHLYQAQRNPQFQAILNADTPPVYATLWSEGLAAYASTKVNPPASAADALGAELATADDDSIRSAACSIRQHLDDASEASAQLYFGGDPHIRTNGLPHRSGYLIGFMVIERMARLNTLQFLLKMRSSSVHTIVPAILKNICGA